MSSHICVTLITFEINMVRFPRPRTIDGPDESSDTLRKKAITYPRIA